MSPEAQAVIDAACVCVDANLRLRDATLAVPDRSASPLEQLRGLADQLAAQSAVYRSDCALIESVDAYRASIKGAATLPSVDVPTTLDAL